MKNIFQEQNLNLHILKNNLDLIKSNYRDRNIHDELGSLEYKNIFEKLKEKLDTKKNGMVVDSKLFVTHLNSLEVILLLAGFLNFEGKSKETNIFTNAPLVGFLIR